MKTRVVPSSEITTEVGLRAEAYVEGSKDGKLDRFVAWSDYCVARDKYLEQAGWKPSAVEVSGALRWWVHPDLGDGQKEFREDQAALIQEIRDCELMGKKR